MKAMVGARAELLQSVSSAQLQLEGMATLIAEAEQSRDRFSRLAPGWQHADQRAQTLRKAQGNTQRSQAQLLEALHEEELKENVSSAAQLWQAAMQTDYQHRNYIQDRVDVRKVNYFVADNCGKMVEVWCVYLYI